MGPVALNVYAIACLYIFFRFLVPFLLDFGVPRHLDMSANASSGGGPANAWEDDWEKQADVSLHYFAIDEEDNNFRGVGCIARANTNAQCRPWVLNSNPRLRRKSPPRSPKPSAEHSKPNLTGNYGQKRTSDLLQWQFRVF